MFLFDRTEVGIKEDNISGILIIYQCVTIEA